MTGVRYKKNP